MEEALSFFWLVWFTRMELGGSNGGIRFCVNDPSSPNSGLELESASDLEAFTSTINDCFE
jgi:hypothetical protein